MQHHNNFKVIQLLLKGGGEFFCLIKPQGLNGQEDATAREVAWKKPLKTQGGSSMKRINGRIFFFSISAVLMFIVVFSMAVSFQGLIVIPKQANAADAGPKYGGTIVGGTYLTTYDPKGFDPVLANYNVDHFISFFAEKLISGDWSKGPMGTNEWDFTVTEWFPPTVMKGCLAESWKWTDPLTLEFKLRKGIKFQNKPPVNGRELTADDVLYSWNRTLNDPKIPKTRYAVLESVTSPNKYTVVFKFKKFVGDWDYLVGYGGYNSIYPHEMVEAGPENWKNACGTGPYILQDYTQGNSITYVKNPDYWDKVTLGRKTYKLPFADKIVLPIIRDKVTRIAALRAGKIDTLYSVNWNDAEELQKSNPELKRKEVLVGDQLQAFFKMAQPPFSDIRIRKAMNMAIDGAAMGKTLYGGKYTRFCYPFMAWWGEELFTPVEKLPPDIKENFIYNPEKAKKLLAEAGYPQGFTTQMVYPNSYNDLVQMMAAYWSQIGVTVKLRVVEDNQIYSIMASKEFEGMIGVADGSSGPIVALRKMLVGDFWNPGDINDQKFKSMYEEARQTRDWEKAKKLLKETNIYGLSIVPRVSPPNPYIFNYWQPWIQGFHGENMTGFFNPAPVFARIWTTKPK
jgi:peptide/nickel transport system substrate-binding protein